MMQFIQEATAAAAWEAGFAHFQQEAKDSDKNEPHF